MNKVLIKAKEKVINEAWQTMATNVMESSWLIGQALLAVKGELEHGDWQAWCETHLCFSYRHVSRFTAIGALPHKPVMPKLLPGKTIEALSIESLASVAARVKKGVKQETAMLEIIFPSSVESVSHFAHEVGTPDTPPVVPHVKTKKEALKYMDRHTALDTIGIVSDKEDVDVFVTRTTLEIVFGGLFEKMKNDPAKLKALKAAKLVLL